MPQRGGKEGRRGGGTEWAGAHLFLLQHKAQPIGLLEDDAAVDVAAGVWLKELEDVEHLGPGVQGGGR